MKKAVTKDREDPKKFPRMFLIPCSCGTTFAISEDFDRLGTHIRSFIPCPGCGKRHDPKNRVLRMDYNRERFWNVNGC
jgi:hydrogenase maturation factor HypF (carbamoyltransferase family)